MSVVAQFPLGTVLVPSMVLPLQVFEPRYQQLASDVLDIDGGGDATFGVVLISRGHEVGGGDQRTMVGTMAKIVEYQAFDDGRWALVTVGARRFRVLRWLDDDPYPKAEIEDWPDLEPSTSAEQLLASTVQEFTRTWATASEAGRDVGLLPTFDADPSVASFQMTSVSPIGTFDQQRLLETPGPDERLTMLSELLGDARELFELEMRDR